MPTYSHHPHRSQIVDVFYVPLFAIESSEWDMTQKERDALQDIGPIKEDLKKQLAPLTEDIKRLCLWGDVASLAHMLYFYLLYQKGQDPKTVAETLALFETLTAEEISTCYTYQIHRSYVEEKVEDIGLMAYLDKIDLPADEKWHWFQAIQKPVETVQALVQLMTQVDQLYQPYYDRFEAERQAYLADFDLDDFFNHMPTMGVKDLATQHGKDYELLVLSPVHIRIVAMLFAEELDMDVLLITSTRMEGLISRNDEMDMDDFSTLLKTMSDETRYRVLQELTQGFKNKAIAEKLGITGAAVSFHTQKLLNAKLILVDSDDKVYKYKVNKGLLSQVTKKLVSDFDLTGRQTGPVTKQMSFRMEKEKEQNDYRTSGDSQQDDRKSFRGQVFEELDEVYNQIDRQLKDTGFEGMIKSIVKNALNKGSQAMRQYASSSENGDGFGFAFQFKTGDKTKYKNRYDLEDELEDVTEELADLEEDIEDLNVELADLTKDLDDLYQKWQSLHARKQELERQGREFSNHN